MKTTIELKGYQIVIDETDDLVTVTATKDDETVEEFSLELSEGETQSEDEDGIKSFDEFGDEEEDFDDNSVQDDEEVQDDEDDKVTLESFQSFINKKR